MKKITFVVCLLGILSICQNKSFAQWELSPDKEGGSYNTIVNRDSLVYAGTFNGVFKSLDGGNTWNRSVSGLYLALDSSLEVYSLLIAKNFLIATTLKNSMAISFDSAKS